MKFGKDFSIHLEETLPDWKDKFLCYKYLKQLIKNYPDQLKDTIDQNHALQILHHWFVIVLSAELKKFNDFYTDKEEDFIIRFQMLKERIQRIKEKSCQNGALTSRSEFSEEMMEIRKDVVMIHGEMVLLKNYSSLNFVGLVKILKKYEKQTGKLLRLPFTRLAVDQPFFITEPLTRLVHECEETLELLFPSEAEIVEPASARADQSDAPADNTEVASTNAASTVGEETMNIYRSTISAIQTIRSLQKTRMRSHDEEDIGSVTAENSASRSPSPAPNGEDGDPEDASSG